MPRMRWGWKVEPRGEGGFVGSRNRQEGVWLTDWLTSWVWLTGGGGGGGLGSILVEYAFKALGSSCSFASHTSIKWCHRHHQHVTQFGRLVHNGGHNWEPHKHRTSIMYRIENEQQNKKIQDQIYKCLEFANVQLLSIHCFIRHCSTLLHQA